MKVLELLQEKKRYGLKEEISKKELKLLKKDVPIQKIMGFINFDNLQINLNYNVLIPRYETEEVIIKALEFIDKESKVLDLCCGSGYIGLTIKQKTNCNVVLSDIDSEAIKQTKENAKLNNLNVKVIKSNIFSDIKDRFDVIVSNPPYIPENAKISDSVINHEPHHALFGGKDGNKFFKKIINEITSYLNNNGVVIFEISKENVNFFKKNNFKIFLDINKKPRVALKQYDVV